MLNKVTNALVSFSRTKLLEEPKLAIFNNFNLSETLKKKLRTEREITWEKNEDLNFEET